ncbi:hypothetical protein ACFX2H_036700 [Malus domestica]
MSSFTAAARSVLPSSAARTTVASKLASVPRIPCASLLFFIPLGLHKHTLASVLVGCDRRYGVDGYGGAAKIEKNDQEPRICGQVQREKVEELRWRRGGVGLGVWSLPRRPSPGPVRRRQDPPRRLRRHWSRQPQLTPERDLNSASLSASIIKRYYAPDPEQDFSEGYDEKDVVVQNLHQACFYKVANESGKPWFWWDYVTDFVISCPRKENKYNQECANQVIKSLGALAWWFIVWQDHQLKAAF